MSDVRKLSAPQRRALETIAQAKPFTVFVTDYHGGGWARERVHVPDGSPRITAQTYAWLREHRLVRETRRGERAYRRGAQTNLRYIVVTPEARKLLGVEIDPARVDLSAPACVEQVGNTQVAGRRVADYAFDLWNGHGHSTDDIVGYVVRETVRHGQVLQHGDGPGGVGYDVFAIEGANRYTRTFPTRDHCRAQEGGYAVVNTLFACGCRA